MLWREIFYAIFDHVRCRARGNTVAQVMVAVHVDGDGNMVITQNPTISSTPKKSGYEPKIKESDGTADAVTTEEVTEFLETFFKLYPTATEKELQRTKATQISKFDLTLEKDSNWKIVK